MSTDRRSSGLLESLFGKTRRSILALLYTHTDESFHLRKILRLTRISPGAGQRELLRLSKAGIIRRSVRDNQVHFQADPDCPIHDELKNLMTKTQGMADVIRTMLEPLGGSVKTAVLHGSVARGSATKDSDVDILVVGDAAFAEIVERFRPAHEILRREINPCVMSEAEFRERISEGDHFLMSILRGALIPLVGDADELVRMARERLAS